MVTDGLIQRFWYFPFPDKFEASSWGFNFHCSLSTYQTIVSFGFKATALTLLSHSFFAKSMSLPSLEVFFIYKFNGIVRKYSLTGGYTELWIMLDNVHTWQSSKYSPVTFSTSSETARWIVVWAPSTTFCGKTELTWLKWAPKLTKAKYFLRRKWRLYVLSYLEEYFCKGI
jgi:hypothetical protein